MRKLLLASVAVLSGSVGMAGFASAQTTPAPTMAPGVQVSPAALPNLSSGVPFYSPPGQVVPGTSYIQNVPSPGPGTITVRFNARVAVQFMAGSDSGRNPGTITPVASSATSLGSQGAPGPGGTTVANSKQDDYTIGEYSRLYPGMDGIAANGLKYGGFMEIRQYSNQPPGMGINGSVSGAKAANGTLFFNVAGVYLGTDQLGYLRAGSTYGPETLFAIGTFENFDDGGWDGDLPGMFSSSSQPAWPFLDNSFWYATNKVVYLSPQFAGFDMAASFEPNTSSSESGDGNCPYAIAANGGVVGATQGGGLHAQGCDATSATTTGDYSRRKDTVELFGRYRGSFGPIGLAANAGIIAGDKVLNDATPQAAKVYKSPLIFDGGMVVSFGGLGVGGHVTGGNATGGAFSSLEAKGARESFAWMLGASYAFGPVIVGGPYFQYQTPGSQAPGITSPWVNNLNEYGVAAGATYGFAPGMNLYASYLYGHVKEYGVDLLTGAASSGTTVAGDVKTHNNVQAQGVLLGAIFKW